MALIETPRTAPFGAITVYQVVSLADELYAAVRRWWLTRQTEKALAGLTDRELADIGLERGMITELSQGLAARA
ncbi:DUF1127 domain-containing protein [Algicella marina]|uniref:DUF1127 domain-containing protein n=1 Tax=Algicella marina TaxID=2683284 RepID=A0A6P1T632_9RHOB|nr:DUF1127 domain-containing protein [Algicella marina]QHQ37205.1 DUF1127 domain-containing protein [Algicella marina]